MSGRRRDPRYVLLHFDGTFRISSDVTVEQSESGDLIATSYEPRSPGEVLTLEIVNGTPVKTAVRVVESRPVIVRGSVRHRVQLTPLQAGEQSDGDRERSAP